MSAAFAIAPTSRRNPTDLAAVRAQQLSRDRENFNTRTLARSDRHRRSGSSKSYSASYAATPRQGRRFSIAFAGHGVNDMADSGVDWCYVLRHHQFSGPG
jgi:hypothetical protein